MSGFDPEVTKYLALLSNLKKQKKQKEQKENTDEHLAELIRDILHDTGMASEPTRLELKQQLQTIQFPGQKKPITLEQAEALLEIEADAKIDEDAVVANLSRQVHDFFQAFTDCTKFIDALRRLRDEQQGQVNRANYQGVFDLVLMDRIALLYDYLCQNQKLGAQLSERAVQNSIRKLLEHQKPLMESLLKQVADSVALRKAAIKQLEKKDIPKLAAVADALETNGKEIKKSYSKLYVVLATTFKVAATGALVGAAATAGVLLSRGAPSANVEKLEKDLVETTLTSTSQIGAGDMSFQQQAFANRAEFSRALQQSSMGGLESYQSGQIAPTLLALAALLFTHQQANQIAFGAQPAGIQAPLPRGALGWIMTLVVLAAWALQS